MSLRIPRPKDTLEVVAGLIGLFFDRFNGPGEGPAAAGTADDLTKINGIGPTFARRLNESGINTYAALAAATPERIREITQVAEWQSNPADWIKEAKDLAG